MKIIPPALCRLSKVIIQSNTATLLGCFVFLTLLIYAFMGIVEVYYKLYQQDSSGRSILVYGMIFLVLVGIRFFAWFGHEVGKFIEISNYRISIHHFFDIKKEIHFPLQYWASFYLFCFLLLLVGFFAFFIGFFSLFIPYAVYKSLFIFLPFLLIIPKGFPGAQFMDLSFLKFSISLAEGYIGSIFVAHLIFFNLIFGFWILNRFIWNIDLSSVYSVLSIIAPIIIALYLLLYWIFMNLWTHLLINE